MKLICLFLIALFMVNISVFAQSETIKVWPEEVPEAIECPNYLQEIDSSDNWLKMLNVSDPVLDYYPANFEKNTGVAVVICPGGAYWLLAIGHEGADVAKWFNKLGISAFVLKYRLPKDKIMEDKTIGPLQDAQEAMRIVRRNAVKWNIDSHKIGIMGFSAGGHLASTLSTHYNEKIYDVNDTISARPDFSLLIYPVISMQSSITHKGSQINLLGENPTEELVNFYSNELQIDENTPPAFLVHSLDDGTVPVQNSINYALSMKKFSLPCELHIYEHGGHGYGLGRSDDTESTWPKACELWLKANEIL